VAGEFWASPAHLKMSVSAILKSHDAHGRV